MLKSIIYPVYTSTIPEESKEVTEATPGEKKGNQLVKRVVLAAICAGIMFMRPDAAGAAVEPKSSWSISAAIKGKKTSDGLTKISVCAGFLDFILHLDVHLNAIIANHGKATYGFLFGIVFCETGLVLTPFLPGDSLLFAAGALAGLGKLDIVYTCSIFIIAAILGDAVNYSIGSWSGQRAINSGVVSKHYIEKTERFYDKHGGKTIVMARFVPIVRTFAPFVAGISRMEYQKFAYFNVGGALLWTFLFCGAGFFFGNLPFVEKNFSLVVLAIVAISVLPVVYEIISERRQQSSSPTAEQK